MFNKELISSDKFIDMPATSQLLFFHLGMNADDEGFVSSPKRIQRSIGCSEDDIKVLISKQFIIGFESGIIVITEWKKHNNIRKDRFTPTIYTQEKAHLQVIDIQQAQPNDNQVTTNGIPSIGKVRLGNNKDCVNFDELSSVSGIPKKRSKIEYTETFEKFWAVYEKHGNKKLAFDKFNKLTEEQLQDLRTRVIPYVKSTNLDGTYPTRKHAQVYLNPTNEHWNDAIIQRQQQTQEGTGY